MTNFIVIGKRVETISFLLKSYTNPEGLTAYGKSCDPSDGLDEPGSECDLFFDICLDAEEIDYSSAIRCVYLRFQTIPSKNQNSVTFEDGLGGGQKNPITHIFKDGWPDTGVQLILTVYDYDERTRPQYIDFIDLVIHRDNRVQNLTLHGREKSRSKLELQYSITPGPCLPNYFGENCDNYCVPQDIDGGHFDCDPLTGKQKCMPGWMGKKCNKVEGKEEKVCRNGSGNNSTCKNGGTCIDINTGFICECRNGFGGLNCEIIIEECQENLCKNGATCYTGFFGFSCKCTPGFKGELCEQPIDSCSLRPCRNDGSCIRTKNGYSCYCRPGFWGKDCEKLMDACNPDPCYNGAKCIKEGYNFLCECKPGFLGETCQFSVESSEEVFKTGTPVPTTPTTPEVETMQTTPAKQEVIQTQKTPAKPEVITMQTTTLSKPEVITTRTITSTMEVNVAETTMEVNVAETTKSMPEVKVMETTKSLLEFKNIKNATYTPHFERLQTTKIKPEVSTTKAQNEAEEIENDIVSTEQPLWMWPTDFDIGGKRRTDTMTTTVEGKISNDIKTTVASKPHHNKYSTPVFRLTTVEQKITTQPFVEPTKKKKGNKYRDKKRKDKNRRKKQEMEEIKTTTSGPIVYMKNDPVEPEEVTVESYMRNHQFAVIGVAASIFLVLIILAVVIFKRRHSKKANISNKKQEVKDPEMYNTNNAENVTTY